MTDVEKILNKYNQALQAHAQAVDTIFDLKYELQKAEIRIGELETEALKPAETEN